MTREEHQKTLEAILKNLDNQGEVSTQLQLLTADYNEVLTSSEEAISENAQLKVYNEALRKADLQNFITKGHKTEDKKDEGTETEENLEKLNYEDLFDTNGMLK